MANQDSTAEIGERLSCTYRRVPQVALKASSSAEFPTSVAGTRPPRLVEVVQLACTRCQHFYEPDLADELGGDGS
jgi:hypothetical protein